jgi:hypothetical protein
MIALGLVLVALVVFSIFCGRKGVRVWNARGLPRGTGYRRSGSLESGSADAVPLQERPKKNSPIRTQRSGLRREASTRLSRKVETFDSL